MRIKFLSSAARPAISIVIVFHNMRREASRTLYSLSRAYQRNANSIPYEVIALDSGSSEPLDKDFVQSHGENFHYIQFKAEYPSPCAALNYGAHVARGRLLTLCIDGARMWSPGILNYTMLAAQLHPEAFVYTLSMHVGRKVQNSLAEENYSQQDEDRLFETVGWKTNGYQLFDISTPALSSKQGFFSKITESNCMTMTRTAFDRLGGFDERFRTPGGGLANLDFFKRLNEDEHLCPVMLLGEATFHQFHGGVATNVPMKDHPYPEMAREYQAIRGKPFEPVFRRPLYFGRVHSRCYGLLQQPVDDWED